MGIKAGIYTIKTKNKMPARETDETTTNKTFYFMKENNIFQNT